MSSPSAVVPGPAAEARRRAALPPADVLRERLSGAAVRAGFVPDGLVGAVDRYLVPAPVTAATWADTPMAEVVDAAVDLDGVTLEVVLADPSIAPELEARLPPGAALVVPTALAAAGVTEIRDELARLGGMAGLAVLGLLIVRYRDPMRVAAAATPVIAALGWTLGSLAALGWPLDAVGTSVIVLILGLSVDYGIFLVDGESHATGVVLCAATSIAGFGTLIASRSPGLASAGLVVAVGLGAAGLAALAITPRLVDRTLLGPRGRWWAHRAAVAAVVAVNLQLLLVIRFVARPPAVPPMPTLAPVTGDDRQLGQDRLIRRHGVWTMSVSGTPAELGQHHGFLAADLRARLEGETFDAFGRAVPSLLGRAAILEGVFAIGAGLDGQIDDRWRTEIAGMVSSAPDPRGWALPGYTRKLYFHALHDIGQALVDSPLVACTGFVATGAATIDGHTLLARNFDFEGGRTFDEDKVVIVRRPAQGLATVSVAFPGMVGVVSGINEAHLAVALQAAGSDVPIHLAEPMTLVLREVLEDARTLDEAEAILDARRGFATELVLAVDGLRGEAVVFEVTPERVVRLPAGELLGVSNHLRSPVFADDVENARRQRDQTTGVRLERIDELLAARRGTLDPSAAVEILRDRSGPGGAALPRGHRWALDADIASHAVAIDATAGILLVSVSPNLSGGFVAYTLDDLLAGDLEPTLVVEPSDPGEALRTHRARELVRDASHQRGADAVTLLRQAARLRPDHPEVLLALAEAVDDPGERAALIERLAGAPLENAADRARLDALRGAPSPSR
ncbi:MAG: C45 family autoproteolytic acyltransferase/hydrolase [Myxococcota bacterium]